MDGTARGLQDIPTPVLILGNRLHPLILSFSQWEKEFFGLAGKCDVETSGEVEVGARLKRA